MVPTVVTRTIGEPVFIHCLTLSRWQGTSDTVNPTAVSLIYMSGIHYQMSGMGPVFGGIPTSIYQAVRNKLPAAL